MIQRTRNIDWRHSIDCGLLYVLLDLIGQFRLGDRTKRCEHQVPETCRMRNIAHQRSFSNNAMYAELRSYSMLEKLGVFPFYPPQISLDVQLIGCQKTSFLHGNKT